VSELSPGWAKIALEELGSWGSGGTPKRTDSRFYLSGTIPWLVIGDLNDGVVTQAQTYITEEGLFNSSAKLLPPNTLLVAMYGSIGKLGITKIECATNQAIAFCIPDQKIIELRYLFHALKHSKNELTAQGQGVAQKNISQTILKAHQIPVAPRREQNLIANKLDALIARVDACRNRLDRVSPILKQFRQSVVNAATSGELTKDWVYTDNPEIWQEALIGDLLAEKPRNGYSPRAVEFETETRSLTLTATTSGRFNPTHIKYIDEKIPEDSYLWLEPDDILIQRANTLEYVGVSAIYDGLKKRYIYPDLMMKCRANSRVLTKFLYYLLSSDDVRSYFRKNATGTTGNMPKINQQTVISAPVCVPPIDEQQEIVRRVDRLFAYADRLETRYRRACAIVRYLTSRLLDKAFRGDLVPQDPKDEPVAVLLERIRAEQSAKPERVMVNRKPKMPKMAEESVKEVIYQLRTETFSFNELREKVPGDYDSFKDTLFTLLSEAEPILIQVFDQEAEAIRFVRGDK